jgi:guanylate kinase
MREGLIYLLAAPSGAGKSTILDGVIAQIPDLQKIVTYTTREPRPGEVDGEEYHFVTVEEFERMKAADELAEWQTIFGHQYGSSRNRLESAIAKGRDLISGYDVLGSAELMKLYPDNVVTMFIKPPSVTELRRRLIGRYGEETEEVRERLERLDMEMSYAYSFKYVVCNIDLREAVSNVASIVRAERCLTSRTSPT